ncbi:MAG: hypothetical protein M3443_12030 [Actinomycetota bacterium]|nr:hypothetical protein [Actinomycetota bacterium]
MITDNIALVPIATPRTTEATALAVIDVIEAGEAPVSDMPLPDELTDLSLLLLAVAALLSPTKGDEGPIEDKAYGYKQDLELVWSF